MAPVYPRAVELWPEMPDSGPGVAGVLSGLPLQTAKILVAARWESLHHHPRRASACSPMPGLGLFLSVALARLNLTLSLASIGGSRWERQMEWPNSVGDIWRAWVSCATDMHQRLCWLLNLCILVHTEYRARSTEHRAQSSPHLLQFPIHLSSATPVLARCQGSLSPARSLLAQTGLSRKMRGSWLYPTRSTLILSYT